MDIAYTKTALKQMKALSKTARKAIQAKIEQYAIKPSSLKNQVKKLKVSLFFRLRVGNYRVIFDKDGTIITIIKVGHRRDIYN